MHRVPRAPGHRLREPVPRVDVVGQRDARRLHVPSRVGAGTTSQDVIGDWRLPADTPISIRFRGGLRSGTVCGRGSFGTPGAAAPPVGTDLTLVRTPFGTPVFERRSGRIIQLSLID